MRLSILLFFLSISHIHSIDYDIDNEQMCIQTPFVADFRCNCTRARFTSDVQVPNNNSMLLLNFIFQPQFNTSNNGSSTEMTQNVNVFLTFIQSSTLAQTIYLTFFSLNKTVLSVNSNTTLAFNALTFYAYVFNTSSNDIRMWKDPVTLGEPRLCFMRNSSFPPAGLTRAYYFNTNETNLTIDLTKSSYRIAPLFISFEICFETISTLSSGGIVFIVLVVVFSAITILLLVICLWKQIKELLYIIRNWINKKTGKGVKIIDTR
ncbi:unnamed protein product [Adineta ricciae]|uniref:Uncharacterized protein n=1 Tax=Adineta ricciae TaxID=249248 RepID=A0A814DCD7_ADIRI|nr:unnamed protein product [Adineta ricciae]CAF0953879.1 unnamed protein product [Adineta ricciae]